MSQKVFNLQQPPNPPPKFSEILISLVEKCRSENREISNKFDRQLNFFHKEDEKIANRLEELEEIIFRLEERINNLSR